LVEMGLARFGAFIERQRKQHNDGVLSFWPHRAPQENAVLAFPLTCRRQMLEIEIGLDTVQYALREGDGILLRHEMEEIRLTRERPMAIRPITKR
jgi:alpha,alpha-trehalose phosphorylase